MVTTRSAEKHATPNDKTESLALRSKPDDATLANQPSDSEASLLGSSRKKTRIVVNVPIPRKRTRLSYSTLDETPRKDEADTGISDNASATGQDAHAPTEIPDSQESVKSSPLEDSKSRFELISSSETPKAQPNTKRKRKTPGVIQSSASTTPTAKAVSSAASQHKRFGHEDLSDNEETNALLNANARKKPVDLDLSESDGDDAAPEVETTKNTSATGFRQQRKSARTKRPARGAQQSALASKTTADETATAEHEALDDVTASTLTIDTTQDLDSTITIGSDDSQDSAFVTARTTRHHDVFATPLGGTPHVWSPSQDELETSFQGSMVRVKQPVAHATKISPELDLPELSTLKLKSARSENRSIALPPKPGNSIERYRQQILRNRLEKSASRRGGGNFGLQEEWSGKRRKFVVTN